MWNRLVLVESGATDVDRQLNEYNGLNWRTRKKVDTDADSSLDLDRQMYYSGSWQLCEERIDDDSAFPQSSPQCGRDARR